MPEQQQFDGRHELVTVLLEKVQADPYPSATMMDLIEEIITPEEVPAYANVLLDKIREDVFPSLDLMIRVRNVS